MAAVSIKQRISYIPDRLTEQELRAVLQAILDGMQGIATQLDADTGVTDTTYASNLALIVND
jgi:hypothetical protein